MEIIKSVLCSASLIFIILALMCWGLHFVRREEAIVEKGQVKIMSWKPLGIAATIAALMCIMGWAFFVRIG